MNETAVKEFHSLKEHFKCQKIAYASKFLENVTTNLGPNSNGKDWHDFCQFNTMNSIYEMA